MVGRIPNESFSKYRMTLFPDKGAKEILLTLMDFRVYCNLGLYI